MSDDNRQAGDRQAGDKHSDVQIRRAPKYSVFILIGGVLGALAALILSSFAPIDPALGFGATFGYFAVFGITLGLLLGAVVALVLDSRSRRRARTVSMTVEKPDQEEPGR